MIHFLDAADVLALTVSEKITGADLDQMMDGLEARLARHDTVQMFVETRSLDAAALASQRRHVLGDCVDRARIGAPPSTFR